MVNILLIDINSLLNYLWMNYILLNKKLFLTQPNVLKNHEFNLNLSIAKNNSLFVYM